jgi:hypothetical protein
MGAVRLTDDSLHLRELARLLLHTHGCDVVVVLLRCVDVDNAGYSLFGGAAGAKSSSSPNFVGRCCRRRNAKMMLRAIAGPRNSNSKCITQGRV